MSGIQSDGVALALHDSREEFELNLIKIKRKELIDGFKRVREKQKKNKFLTEILEEYVNHFATEKSQKQKQHHALIIITNHIDEIAEDTELTREKLLECTSDQKDILAKMNEIQTEMDELEKDLSM